MKHTLAVCILLVMTMGQARSDWAFSLDFNRLFDQVVQVIGASYGEDLETRERSRDLCFKIVVSFSNISHEKTFLADRLKSVRRQGTLNDRDRNAIRLHSTNIEQNLIDINEHFGHFDSEILASGLDLYQLAKYNLRNRTQFLGRLDLFLKEISTSAFDQEFVNMTLDENIALAEFQAAEIQATSYRLRDFCLRI